MRKLLPLFLFLLVPAMSARAQDQSAADAGLNDNDAQNSSVVTVASPDPAPAPQFPGAGNAIFPPWELGFGYQFNDIRPPSLVTFDTSGINASITRFFGGTWFGIEGDLGVGFGNTGKSTYPANLVAKSTFFGGGPRIAYRSNGRWEPWGHFLFGLEHFRFTETATGYGSNNAFGFLAGGGLDIHLNPRLAIRAEGDYLGTNFFKTWERNLQIVAGIVLDF